MFDSIIEGLTDSITDSVNRLFDKEIRIGVTGLSRGGKTAFITSLVNTFLNFGNEGMSDRLSRFSAYDKSGIFYGGIAPNHDLSVPQFPYQECYDALVATFGSQGEMYKSLLLGTRNGSLGETSTILLMLGGAYLIYKGYINWVVPVGMIATVGVLTWLFGPAGFGTGDPLFHVMAGGLMLGAFFMATDMVTIPMTITGQMIFAVGAGALTVLIRLAGGYPEGVCYSLLLMNAVTPLIDRYVKPRIFGAPKGGAN